MPLREHFTPPPRTTWQSFHGLWPTMIVQKLFGQLPPRYRLAPNYQLGRSYEIDIGAFDTDPLAPRTDSGWIDESDGGVATLTRTEILAEPMVDLGIEFPPQDEVEVHIYDDEYDQRLVAAIEFVSPANKDRPDSRKAFVSKCTQLLRQKVCVALVDVVTNRNFNLYSEILAQFDDSEPKTSSIYSAMLRSRIGRTQSRIQAWHFPLKVGKPIPPLPLELSETEAIEVDLEGTYEETCKYLRIE